MVSNFELSNIKRKVNLFLIFCISTSGCLFGYNIGAMSGVLLFITNEMQLSHVQASLFVSSFLWGVVVVMLLMGHLADWFGRKKTLIISALTAIVSICLMTSAKNIDELIIARFLVGAASGMITITVPLYLSEAVPSSLRAKGTVAFQLFVCFGILFSTIISWLFLASHAWRAIFLYEFIPVILLIAIALYVPESPRWLVMKKRNKEAFHVLLKTRSKESSEGALFDMQTQINENDTRAPIAVLFHKPFLKPFIIVVLIGILNQLTGINTILQYDSTILFISGYKHNEALIGSILITSINFLSTIVAVFIIDKVERKHLLQFGLIGIVFCLIGISAAHYFIGNEALKGILVTCFVIGFISFFALAPGAMIWTVLSEILPLKVRSIGMSIALCLSSITGATLSAIFLPLQAVIGLSGVFLLCALATIIYIFVSRFIPNTKGKSLEDIEKNLSIKAEATL